jgi:hypothetical protein
MLHVPTKYAARVVVELSLLGPLTDFAAFCKDPSQLIILISFTSATISAALSQRHYLHIHIRHISVNSKFLQNHDDAQIWLANHIKATKIIYKCCLMHHVTVVRAAATVYPAAGDLEYPGPTACLART